MNINAENLHFKVLNQQVRQCEEPNIVIDNCCGQRYIAAGLSGREIEIYGTPGNALGAYLDGCEIYVHGNAQDAAGDTMNDGCICIDGMAGDAAGYAMRGGSMYIRGNAGYRAGIHMKAYQEKQPLLVIGGAAGSFLGEYQAGGTIIVLGLGCKGVPVGNFCGMGMHGGRIFLRTEELPPDLSQRLVCAPATPEEMDSIRPALERFCAFFRQDEKELFQKPFYCIVPNSRNPYRQLYTGH